MLLPTSRTSPGLSRRAMLGSGRQESWPACYRRFAHTGSSRTRTGPGRRQGQGPIYVSAALLYKPEGKDEEQTHHNMIIAIDPATGKWHKIADKVMTAVFHRTGRP